MKNRRTYLALLTCVAFMNACGGGAGDAINTSGENTIGASLVEPFVGVWQLTSGWSSSPTDDALLVIRTPETIGAAEVVLYDFTDEANVSLQCFRAPFGNGELVDSLTNEVFVNFREFTNGIASLINENMMVIEFQDSNDINANGNTDDRISTTLTRVAQVEADIAPLCTS